VLLFFCEKSLFRLKTKAGGIVKHFIFKAVEYCSWHRK